ncbi:MAG: ImmA/IrrE family metallo-endopeptidase [Candidatus Diapherotrites archaeon]|nr:ImmA/IrrE family metallo-endopeptidase [Candidatus Diapherotrites archaeon]
MNSKFGAESEAVNISFEIAPLKKLFSASGLEKMIEGFVQSLSQETDALLRSQFFKKYLDCMAKFWRYSYRNQLLIFTQKSNAARVAGFKTWNELGRQVIKGEKAIKILAPFTKKIMKKDAKTGEEKEVKFTFFSPVSVFDISQTTGDRLPEIECTIQGSNQEWLLKKLLAFCKTQKIKIEFKKLGINGLYGYSANGKIFIDSTQTINTQSNTLIHEIAHELNHYTPEGKKFSKQEKEIQAEATTYAVTKALGLENKSVEYLAFHIYDKNKILENLKTISATTKKILENIV